MGLSNEKPLRSLTAINSESPLPGKTNKSSLWVKFGWVLQILEHVLCWKPHSISTMFLKAETMLIQLFPILNQLTLCQWRNQCDSVEHFVCFHILGIQILHQAAQRVLNRTLFDTALLMACPLLHPHLMWWCQSWDGLQWTGKWSQEPHFMEIPS